jgi:hypothetical protein
MMSRLMLNIHATASRSIIVMSANPDSTFAIEFPNSWLQDA